MTNLNIGYTVVYYIQYREKERKRSLNKIQCWVGIESYQIKSSNKSRDKRSFCSFLLDCRNKAISHESLLPLEYLDNEI